MTINATTAVGSIAADYPIATRVFARHQIDFCCGGGKPLGEVCEARGLDPQTVLKELQAELEGDTTNVENWKDAPLPELIDHIVATYHRPLEEELPRLEFMARKVLRVHGDKMPEVLRDLVSTFVGLKAELEDHMVKEEQVLFPMILKGEGSAATSPIDVLEDEHTAAGEALRHLRELTDDYQPPQGACNTWRALWFGLGELETAMHKHIHLENNILFPRSLAN